MTVGRFVGGMIVLYLQFSSASDAEPGFTVSRFQAFCFGSGSVGRAQVLLTMVGLSRYLVLRRAYWIDVRVARIRHDA